MGGRRRGTRSLRIARSAARRGSCAVACLLCLCGVAAAEEPISQVERDCREWANEFFSEATERREQEIARCIADRDPGSPQARALQERAIRDAQARAAVSKRLEREALEALAREEEETRGRCGGELVEALAPLYFCDTRELVSRKAATSGDLRCASPGACDRLRLRLGNAELWVYPKFSERGLRQLALYGEERTAADYHAALRDDWQRVVTAIEARHGPAIDGGTPFPDFFAVHGVDVLETHRWELGRRQIRVGVFAADSAYAARLTVDDSAQIDSSARGKR
jgi:hypothetical protein